MGPFVFWRPQKKTHEIRDCELIGLRRDSMAFAFHAVVTAPAAGPLP
jgi:hypothetical protein